MTEGSPVAREGIPITPELLRWARERAGFSLQELIPEFRGIATWESGAAFPTYPQLERLSEKFKVPIAVFFFPEPPDEPPIRQSFRNVPSVQFEALPRRIRFLLRKATALRVNLAELNDGRNPAERFILNDLRFSRNMDVRRMALRVRDYLAVPLEEQMDWPDSEHAFARWRDVLEQHGVAVFKDAFLDDDYAGFCLYDAVFPLIYVNNSVRTREIFTLFHELGHLLFHTSGIDVLGDDPPVAGPASGRAIEATCNQFAAEFLLPEERFAADASESAPTDDRVEALAERYSVSRESVLRRFLDRGQVTVEEYRRRARRWEGQRRDEGGGNHYWTKITHLGTAYINLAFSRYHQNRITEVGLADYLDTKVKHLSKLEDYFGRKVV